MAISAMTTVEDVAAVYRPLCNEPKPGQLDDIAYHAILGAYPDTSSCTIHSATSWTCIGPVDDVGLTVILGRPVINDVTVRLSDDGCISSLTLNWGFRFTSDEQVIVNDWGTGSETIRPTT
jgi:hypothetical protein